MRENPFTVTFELEGWQLVWAFVEIRKHDPGRIAELRSAVASAVRERFPSPAEISRHPTVAAMRTLFRGAGCDPTRYRPASEALLRRLVKGADLPAIQPIVDLNNCLSAELAVPCCVMTEGTFGTELTMRAGLPGENYVSLRGPFNLEKKPVLADSEGAVDTPITGNEKVKVSPDTEKAWLVAYLPEGVVARSRAFDTLQDLAKRCGLVATCCDE
jgi:DNA/RNA-binding domain of Phe-tRNA-synthetase-like protein